MATQKDSKRVTEKELAVLNSPETIERLRTGIAQAHAGRSSPFESALLVERQGDAP
jgi:hypothetical protein